MTELEQRLRNSLAILLAIEPADIPITSRFDELGVDSLVALRLTRQVLDLTGIEIDIECILENPSVERLADYLSGLGNTVVVDSV